MFEIQFDSESAHTFGINHQTEGFISVPVLPYSMTEGGEWKFDISKRVLARTTDWTQMAVFSTFILYVMMLEINSFQTPHEISGLDTSGIFVRMYLICVRG